MQQVMMNGSRYYVCPNGHRVPSVTTILSATQSEEKRRGLAEWRARVGNAEADRITREASMVGTLMHGLLEEGIDTGIIPPPPDATDNAEVVRLELIARPMANVIIESGIGVRFSDIIHTELSLYYPGLYAGTTDGVGRLINTDELAIFDYKQTNKPKTDAMVEDYKIQLAAYILAYNYLYGATSKMITTGIIMMCSRDLHYQEWTITGDELIELTDKWLNRCAMFHENNT